MHSGWNEGLVPRLPTSHGVLHSQSQQMFPARSAHSVIKAEGGDGPVQSPFEHAYIGIYMRAESAGKCQGEDLTAKTDDLGSSTFVPTAAYSPHHHLHITRVLFTG